MDTSAPASACHHATLRITTCAPTGFTDLTDQLERLIDGTAIRFGLLNVQTLHTTTGVIVNEHEPLLLSDFQALLEAVVPAHGGYRHDDTAVRTVNLNHPERTNGHAHCRALLLPSSACLNIVEGRLRLGRWQRVFLVELDGPRDREVSVLLVATCGGAD